MSSVPGPVAAVLTAADKDAMAGGPSSAVSAVGAGPRSRRVRGLLATLLTAACVAFLVSNTTLSELERALRQADYGLLALAFAIGVLAVLSKGVRWWALYPARGRPSVALAIAGVAVGQVANWAAPFRTGEVIRLGLVATSEPVNGTRGVALGLGVLLIEKLLDAAVLLLTVLVVVVLVGVPAWLSQTALLASLIACSLGFGLALHIRRWPGGWTSLNRSWLGDRLPSRITWLFDNAGGVGEGLSAWLTPRACGQAIAWSLAAWVLGAATNFVVLRSAGLNPQPTLAASLAVLAALYGAAVVPALPGRLGVFQYVCVVTLAPFGVPLAEAVVFSLALYLVVYAPPAAIGLASIAFLEPAVWRRLVFGARRP